MKNKINDKNQTQNARHEGSVIVVPSNNGSHLSSDINDNEQKNQEGVLSVNEKIENNFFVLNVQLSCFTSG